MQSPWARFRRAALLVILSFQGGLLLFAAIADAPTLDEPAHLVAGISHWRFARFDLYRVNPPLPRMIASLPVLAFRPTAAWQRWGNSPGARYEGEVADDFLHANGTHSCRLIFIARMAMIPLSLLGAYLCYIWSTELYGWPAGVAAAALWCFDPSLLAHGHLVTPDVAAATTGLAAGYYYWRWLRWPGWGAAVRAGIALGLAELTKTTWIILFGLWPALWLLDTARRCRCQRGDVDARDGLVGAANASGRFIRTPVAQLVVLLMLGVYVLNLGYGFTGTGRRLGEYTFFSHLFTGRSAAEPTPWAAGNRFSGTVIGSMPVPLPSDYVAGIDLQRRDFEFRKPCYLRGRWRFGGWWYYYAYAVAVKLPIGSLVLLFLTVAAVVARRVSNRVPGGRDGTSARLIDAMVLLAPATVVVALVSSQAGLSRHVRYMLPAFPFAIVCISGLWQHVGRQNWRLAAIATGLLVWSASSSLAIYPGSISYFNGFVGGPRGGPDHLLDSNIDWGQDLLRLARWSELHPSSRPLALVYFGPLDPRLVGIEFALPPKALDASEDLSEIANVPQDLQPGWYALSVNFLYGYPQFAPDGRGSKEYVGRAYYSYFRRFELWGTAGYSIWIYHVTLENLRSSGRLNHTAVGTL